MLNIYLKIMDGCIEISKSPMLCVFNVHDTEMSAHWQSRSVFAFGWLYVEHCL